MLRLSYLYNDIQYHLTIMLSIEYDWRNRDVNSYISNEGYDNSIHVIPFRDLTLPLYSMHPSNDTHQDCTHYCYFPQMWQNMWYYLYHRRN